MKNIKLINIPKDTEKILIHDEDTDELYLIYRSHSDSYKHLVLSPEFTLDENIYCEGRR